MEKPVLTEIQQLMPIFVQTYERYLPTAFDDSMTMLEKTNKVIEHLNRIGELSNQTVAKWNEVMKWFLENGLEDAVNEDVNTKIEDGTFTTLINQTILGEINEDVEDIRANKADKSYVQTVLESAVSGAPVDIVSTVENLNATYPNGLNRPVLVESDGSLYAWNGNAWLNIGVYQNSVLSNKSVSPEKTTFLKYGKNLFNKETITPDTVLSTSGTAPLAGYALSDYMAVDPNTDYAFSKPRHVRFFDASKNEIGTLINSTTNEFLTVRSPSNAKYARISVLNANIPIMQVEKGTVSTSFEGYGLFSDDLKILATKLIGKITGDLIDKKTILENNLSFIQLGKNQYDLKKATKDIYLNQNNGAVVSFSGYYTSDYIPIETGKTYTISSARKVVFYDEMKIFKSGLDQAQGKYTFTATYNGFVRFSYSTLSPVTAKEQQFEEGSVVTGIEPFGYYFNDLMFNTQQRQSVSAGATKDDLTVTKNGELFTIESLLNEHPISIETTRSGSANGSFNFIRTTLDDLVHTTNDDITPIRTFNTVGANHGYTSIAVVVGTHDKTTADLGSRWTDGTREYVLLDVIANELTFSLPYTETNGIVAVPSVTMGASLTHVGGATNQSAIVSTSLKASPQLYPSINKKSVRYVLDGKEIKDDGVYYGKELQVQERYNVMDYKALVEYAKNNIGMSFKNDNVDGVVNLSINYTFTKGANCTISHTMKALKKVSVGNCGFLQAIALAKSSHTLKRYMPDVLPINGLDFEQMVDMTNYAENILVQPSAYKNPSVVPTRYTDWLMSGATKKFGFTMGYLSDKTKTKHSDRLANTNVAWDLRSTKKSYPVAISNKTLEAGDYLYFEGFRNYLVGDMVGNATVQTIVKDKGDTYVYVDSHTNLVNQNVFAREHIGKKVEVLESRNFTLKNDVVDSDGVTYDISSSYGYAILKLK